MLTVKNIGEAGYAEACFGLGFSYNLTTNQQFHLFIDNATNHFRTQTESLLDRLGKVARKIAPRGNGEDKFLEFMVVYLDINAPRYFWQQFDTYRIGVTRLSASTMHTLTKRELTQTDFAAPIHVAILAHLNSLILAHDWQAAKAHLPEAFLQRRLVCTNYKALKHMVAQRHDHRLPEWPDFCQQLKAQLQHPEFINWS